MPQDFFQHFFGDSVDIGGSLIEDQQLRITKHCTDKGDKLFLSQADAISRRDDLCGQPFVKPGKQRFKPRLPEDGVQVLVGEVFIFFIAIQDILLYGTGEEKRFLQDKAYLFSTFGG